MTTPTPDPLSPLRVFLMVMAVLIVLGLLTGK